MGFEPTTLRDLVGCSNHLSYWRLYGEQGPICGSRLEPHHAATQPSNDRHTRSEELTNSIRLDHGGSWVQIPSGTRIFFPSPPQINIMLLLFHL